MIKKVVIVTEILQMVRSFRGSLSIFFIKHVDICYNKKDYEKITQF